MRVRVRLYSVLRELVGTGELEFEIPESQPYISNIIDIIRKKAGNPDFELIVYDSNGRKLDASQRVPADSVLHVMPPPSGGSRLMIDIVPDSVPENEVVDRIRKFISESIDDETGAILVFTGIVRGVNRDRRVKALKYEAADDIALKVFEQIAREILQRNNVKSVGGIHYVGVRKPGSLTMILAVTGVSRKNVFPALEEFIERVKHELPIWKVEVTDEGTYHIIGGDSIEFPSDS